MRGVLDFALATKRHHSFNLSSFGAMGDGTTLNTAAFEKAVEAVKHAGEGEIRVGSGTYLTAPFNLTSHLTLYLEEGAIIIGSTNISLYPVLEPLPSYGRGRDYGTGHYTSFI